MAKETKVKIINKYGYEQTVAVVEGVTIYRPESGFVLGRFASLEGYIEWLESCGDTVEVLDD